MVKDDVRDVSRVGDARMSGTGSVVLHVSPVTAAAPPDEVTLARENHGQPFPD